MRMTISFAYSTLDLEETFITAFTNADIKGISWFYKVQGLV